MEEQAFTEVKSTHIHTHTINVSSFQTTKSFHYYDQVFQVWL